MLTAAGFVKPDVKLLTGSKDFIKDWMPGSGAEEHIVSAEIVAWKPSVPKKGRKVGCLPCCQ